MHRIQDAYLLHPPDLIWRRSDPLGAAATVPPTPTPTRSCHWGDQHTQQQEIWDSAGGLSGRSGCLQPHSTHQNEDLHGGVLSESAWIRHFIIDSMTH